MRDDWRLGANLAGPPDEAASADFFAYERRFTEDRVLEQWDLVIGRAKLVVPEERTRVWTRQFIKERIAVREPLSLIRIGDGEGNILFGLWGEYSALSAYMLGRISTMHFGSIHVVPENLEFFGKELTDSIQCADVLGLPHRSRIVRSFVKAELPNVAVRGVCGVRGVFNFLSANTEINIDGCSVVSAWVSRDLISDYFDLLAGETFLGLISCHEHLAAALAARVPTIQRVQDIRIPGQPKPLARNKGTGHYPEAYHRVIDEIRPPFRGAVYFVAAGLLGKSYCRIIRDRGGIAIDIGAVADVWMGKKSRAGISERFIETWRLG